MLTYHLCFARVSNIRRSLFLLLLVSFTCRVGDVYSQAGIAEVNYVVSIPQPENHTCRVELGISQWKEDTICLKLPNWMPGYYQMMGYWKDLEDLSARDQEGFELPVERMNNNTWKISGIA